VGSGRTKPKDIQFVGSGRTKPKEIQFVGSGETKPKETSCWDLVIGNPWNSVASLDKTQDQL
jgi:hypothetical protein